MNDAESNKIADAIFVLARNVAGMGELGEQGSEVYVPQLVGDNGGNYFLGLVQAVEYVAAAQYEVAAAKREANVIEMLKLTGYKASAKAGPTRDLEDLMQHVRETGDSMIPERRLQFS